MAEEMPWYAYCMLVLAHSPGLWESRQRPHSSSQPNNLKDRSGGFHTGRLPTDLRSLEVLVLRQRKMRTVHT
jgi:hypothetical protein